ncbi:MAG: hypothetical protein ACYCXG_09295 [Acidiferrobacter sp.]
MRHHLHVAIGVGTVAAGLIAWGFIAGAITPPRGATTTGSGPHAALYTGAEGLLRMATLRGLAAPGGGITWWTGRRPFTALPTTVRARPRRRPNPERIFVVTMGPLLGVIRPTLRIAPVGILTPAVVVPAPRLRRPPRRRPPRATERRLSL